MVHPSKPGEMPKKFLTERSLQPGEIPVLGNPAADLVLFLSLLAEDLPSLLAFTELNTSAHEVSSFRRQGQVIASVGRRRSADGTVSLIHHG
jgi:hypothetical protein